MQEPMPVLIDVTITAEDEMPDVFTVRPMWGGVDRPEGTGYAVRGMKLARRLEAALRAGAVYRDLSIKTDIYNQTYASTTGSQILGRTMNADLTRLGY